MKEFSFNLEKYILDSSGQFTGILHFNFFGLSNFLCLLSGNVLKMLTL